MFHMPAYVTTDVATAYIGSQQASFFLVIFEMLDHIRIQ